eukprot:12956-Eustigmatos_ZCMA.PRE.1
MQHGLSQSVPVDRPTVSRPCRRPPCGPPLQDTAPRTVSNRRPKRCGRWSRLSVTKCSKQTE